VIVADTNLLAYLLIEGKQTAASRRVLQRDAAWAAPALWRSELLSVLVQRLRNGAIGLPEAAAIMEAAALTVRGREYLVESARVLALALASGCTAYDCEFVALAEALGVPLVTSDRDVLRAFPKLAVTAEQFAAA
jgi:predicted nucleic acid-binding protein